MASVYYSKVLEVSADVVWTVVRDFGALDLWFPFVSKCALRDGAGSGTVGVVRANTVADGKVIEEELLELSDVNRRIIYSVISGDVPTTNYSATLTVHDVTGEERAFVEWSTSFEVQGDAAPVIEWVRTGIFQTCLNELERVLQARQ